MSKSPKTLPLSPKSPKVQELHRSDSTEFEKLQEIDDNVQKIHEMLQFIQNERTSPRGRVDALLTNTQHTLEMLKIIIAQVERVGCSCIELKYIKFEVTNLTDELTKLRAHQSMQIQALSNQINNMESLLRTHIEIMKVNSHGH
jgi:hypothetical protein